MIYYKNTSVFKKIFKKFFGGSSRLMIRTKQPKKIEYMGKKHSNKNTKNEKNENNGNHTNGNNGLTLKQEAFVREYLVDLSATRAAIRAGYKEHTAGVTGCQNLKHPKIQEAIAKEMELREERTRVTQDKVVKELAKLAFSNMRSFVRWGPSDVKLLDSNQLTDDDAACVMEVSQTESASGATTVRFKLYNKKDALELLGKHLGMFADTMKHIGENGGPIAHAFNFDDKSIKDAFDRLYGVQEQGK
jgi:phage terminase small subunit